MIVFVVAAVLGVGVLAALWFAWEPLFPFIAWLVSMDWFFVVEAILLGITAIGLLVVGIVKLVYLYRTAKRFREYQPAALQKEVL